MAETVEWSFDSSGQHHFCCRQRGNLRQGVRFVPIQLAVSTAAGEADDVFVGRRIGVS